MLAIDTILVLLSGLQTAIYLIWVYVPATSLKWVYVSAAEPLPLALCLSYHVFRLFDQAIEPYNIEHTVVNEFECICPVALYIFVFMVYHWANAVVDFQCSFDIRVIYTSAYSL